MLRTDALTLAYPGRLLARDLAVQLRGGEIWAVLGRNGSGKSTFIHALAGLQAAQAGSVRLDEEPLGSISRRALAKRIGVMLQEENREFWGSARDYVLLGRYPHARSPFGWSVEDERIADEELHGMHLDALAASAYASLSGGERQRARCAELFAQRPDVYLLDEPLQHMDLPHQTLLLDRLAAEARNRNAVVVMVLHDLLLAARYCNHFLLFFGDGRWRAGTAAEMLDAGQLGELYGFPLTAVEAAGERLFLPARRPAQGPHV
ncbi:MAG TPA: ABC transporter ATP-binding protein [Burkholderiales bacterium]|nr:ABC transporter ATP-binding protein [Burkholderiales bacterium]